MTINTNENSGSRKDIDLVGRTIGDYEVVRRLGKGGMAFVYLAEQKSLRRNVALKVLRHDLSDDQSYVRRFHREAQAAASLVQANIVQIYEVGEADGIHFIAQEYVRGQNLRQYLSRFGAVEAVMAANVLRQTAMALQKAAANNPVVIHRDIKPENIMLSTGGEIKVADFGLARVNDQQNKQDLTQIGITMGTPLYMSPEQVEGSSVDPRSDIYSLGITAYHMLTGNPPFQGDNALAIAVQHVKNDPPSLRKIRPDIPPALADLVHSMIAKKPKDRIQSPGEILKALRKIEIDTDEDWDALAERIAFSDIEGATIESRLAVTQQLQTVMMGKVQSWWQTKLAWISMAVLAFMGVGIAVATAPKATDPLEIEVSQSEDVPKKQDVKEQFRAAQWKIPIALDQQNTTAMLDAALYFQAVIDFFPVDPESGNASTTRHYHYLCHQHLGEIYWRTNHWEKANDEFLILKNLPETHFYLRITGIAGHALYLDFLGETEAVMDLLSELERDNNFRILNDYFQERLQELFKRYPASMGSFRA